MVNQDMLTSVERLFGTGIEMEFRHHGIEARAMVGPSKSPAYDISSNGCFSAAKDTEYTPAELACLVAEQILLTTSIGEITTTGGYINLKLSDEIVISMARLGLWTDVPDSANEKVLIDFGGPNIAKPMHVGHLRSMLIGNSLRNILLATGHTVVGDIHYGDWGYQMGLLLAAFPDREPASLEELETAYPLASTRAKEDDDFRTKAHDATVALQSGDPHAHGRWMRMVELSKESVHRDIENLGVKFDVYFGESHAHPFITKVEEKLGDALIESEGALIVETRYGPLMFRNSAGGYLYAATDLATIIQREGFDRIVYVVDERQADHFKKVFEVANKYLTRMKLVHAGFGTVNGPDGKPFRTRDGGVPSLDSLLKNAKDKADSDEVAMAAIKFGDLSNSRKSSYAFDMDKFVSFEGRTGPYLLYQIARIHSIISKANVKVSEIVISSPEERAILMMLGSFPRVLERAEMLLEPSVIAEYAYLLAKAFSKDYGNGERISDNGSRLAIAEIVLDRLEYCAKLLGIDTLSKM